MRSPSDVGLHVPRVEPAGIEPMSGRRVDRPTPGFFFLLFLISGFCSLVYETIWTRLVMAAFGVTTASVSIAVSVFMGGLAIGSLLAGHLVRRAGSSPRRSLRAHAATEELIRGVGF